MNSIIEVMPGENILLGALEINHTDVRICSGANAAARGRHLLLSR